MDPLSNSLPRSKDSLWILIMHKISWSLNMRIEICLFREVQKRELTSVFGSLIVYAPLSV